MRRSPYLTVLKDAGYRVLAARQHKHYVARCMSPGGEVEVFTIPVSPSDHRGILNFRAQVRRRLRQEHPA
jgi:hypothetical protein